MKYLGTISTAKFNVLIAACILVFGLIARVAKAAVEKYVAISSLGVIVVCFLANASVLLPSSSILIVIEYSMIINPVLAALCGALGCSLGEMTGFYVGRCGGKSMTGRYLRWVEMAMAKYKYLIVVLFSALPLPVFDIIGMLSGAMEMSGKRFFIACFLGKLIKMLCYVFTARMLTSMIL